MIRARHPVVWAPPHGGLVRGLWAQRVTLYALLCRCQFTGRAPVEQLQLLNWAEPGSWQSRSRCFYIDNMFSGIELVICNVAGCGSTAIHGPMGWMGQLWPRTCIPCVWPLQLPLQGSWDLKEASVYILKCVDLEQFKRLMIPCYFLLKIFF